MSRSESITITCPACKNKQPFTVWQSINATLDPKLKQKVLDLSLVTFKCDKCGHTAGIEQDLMYHDMERKLMIFRGEEEPGSSPDDTLESLVATAEPEYTYRLVGSIDELVEKILIWDAGLDDRVVEIVKQLLMGRIDDSQRGKNAALFFGEVYREANSEKMVQFVLVNDSGSTAWAVPFEQTIQKCDTELRKVLPARDSERGKWLRVDRQYAQKYLSE